MSNQGHRFDQLLLQIMLLMLYYFSVSVMVSFTSGGRCCLTSMASKSFLRLLICLLTPCHIQVSVSKARAIIVLAEDGNADQV